MSSTSPSVYAHPSVTWDEERQALVLALVNRSEQTVEIDLLGGVVLHADPEDANCLANRGSDCVNVRSLTPGPMPNRWPLPPSSVTHLALRLTA